MSAPAPSAKSERPTAPPSAGGAASASASVSGSASAAGVGSGPVSAPASGGASVSGVGVVGSVSSRTWWALGLSAGAVCLAYRPNLAHLWAVWSHEPNYSHGFLVGPVALALAWQRRGILARGEGRRARGWAWGAGLLAVSMAARAWLYQRGEIWLENLTFLGALTGALWASGGRRALAWSWPALVFLLFLFPLPGRIDGMLAMPLQRVATIGSATLLQLLGAPVLVEGNVLIVAEQRLEVARACNGLSMMMSLVCLVTAAVFLVEAPLWKRAALLAMAAPIAVLSNVLRITATGLCFLAWPGEVVEKYAHDWAGYAMMPAGFGLILLAMRLLSWLVVEERVSTRRVPVFGGGPVSGSGAGSGGGARS